MTALDWIVREASGLLAATGTLAVWFGGARIIGSTVNWLDMPRSRPRHIRGKDQLRKVYRTNWPGVGRVYVLQPPAKVVEGRKN